MAFSIAITQEITCRRSGMKSGGELLETYVIVQKSLEANVVEVALRRNILLHYLLLFSLNLEKQRLAFIIFLEQKRVLTILAGKNCFTQFNMRIAAWLLLTFFICLHNQLNFIHSIITYRCLNHQTDSKNEWLLLSAVLRQNLCGFLS